MHKTITVRFMKDGGFTIEANGFVGGSCLAATKVFEDALGVGDAAERVEKPEMMQQEITQSGYVSGT